MYRFRVCAIIKVVEDVCRKSDFDFGKARVPNLVGPSCCSDEGSSSHEVDLENVSSASVGVDNDEFISAVDR